jgi:UDP-GlcNAc:undecaprenyl-phosphate/decaprenyl-phosphate GlcNAc-1-phosphate transferase
MSMWTAGIVSVGLALLAGWGVPALGMRALMPTLDRSCVKVRNYRGREVTVGLGVVWALWAVAVWTVTAVANAMDSLPGLAVSEARFYPDALREGAWLAPVLLVLATFAFGLMDDVFGDPSAKGFRGHVAALRHGRLTTGGVKMLGIGFAALAACVEPALRRSFAMAESAPEASSQVLVVVAGWLLGAAVVALSANLVNLTDLRPGRALKVYSLLACVAVAATIPWALSLVAVTEELPVSMPPVAQALLTALTIAILLLGPVFAVWRFDLGERGMLGDAGANAAGAVAGFVLAATLPVWGLAVAAAVLLALNLASEKVSFSAVIERVGFLRWFDGLGRVRDGLDGTTGSDADDIDDASETTART